MSENRTCRDSNVHLTEWYLPKKDGLVNPAPAGLCCAAFFVTTSYHKYASFQAMCCGVGTPVTLGVNRLSKENQNTAFLYRKYGVHPIYFGGPLSYQD